LHTFINDDGYDGIVEKINNHPMLNGCDVCNLYYRHGKVREEIDSIL
jgi:hypothetical protein